MFFKDVIKEFPTLNNNPDLVYLDSAASTQTHQRVLDKMSDYYEHKRCNVNRGDFRISQEVSADI
jgi:cysteine desulfurase/selenocysteine lyase